MSIVTARFELPPTCRILPGRYMAALDDCPATSDASRPAGDVLPVPAVSTRYIVPLGSKPKMRPSGARKLRGFRDPSVEVSTPLSSLKLPLAMRTSGLSPPP